MFVKWAFEKYGRQWIWTLPLGWHLQEIIFNFLLFSKQTQKRVHTSNQWKEQKSWCLPASICSTAKQSLFFMREQRALDGEHRTAPLIRPRSLAASQKVPIKIFTWICPFFKSNMSRSVQCLIQICPAGWRRLLRRYRNTHFDTTRPKCVDNTTAKNRNK